MKDQHYFGPPKLAQRLLSWIVSKELYEEILGDLNEEYADRYQRRGRSIAFLNYFVDVVRFARMYHRGRHYQSSNRLSMFQNYLKIALRNVLKHKTYTFINVGGLGVGVACVLLITLFVKVETGHDKFHKNGKDIYRLQHVYGFINAQAGPAFEREYADVLSSLRINPWLRQRKISVSKTEEYHEDVYMADENLFDFFSFPLVEGNATSCLQQLNAVAISASLAQKMFGDKVAMGQTIRIEDAIRGEETPFQITAVFEDLPYNSHLQFDVVVPFDLMENDPARKAVLQSWPNDWIGTYVQLESGSDHTEVAGRYQEIWKKYVNEDSAGIDFMPLEDLYLESHYLNNDYARHGNANHVKIFIAIAVIVLLIASINFMNLATAQSGKRSKEVGLRKVMGAHRKQLIVQFFAESVLMTFISFLLAAGILSLAIPWVSHEMDIELLRALDDPWWMAIGLLSIFVLTVVGTSAYPAFLLSSFRPAVTLKGQKLGSKGINVVRRLLVVFQFATSIALIIGSLIVYDQMRFVKKKDLGFEAEDVLVFNFGSSQQLSQKWPVVKKFIEQMPGVREVMASQQVPGDNAYYWGYKFEGFSDYEYPTGDAWLGYYMGPGMVEGLDMEVVLGRAFDASIPTDSNAFMLNESAWERAKAEYGEMWGDPIGKSIQYFTSNSGQWAMEKQGVVIGVLKDFHHHSLQRPIEPLVIHNGISRRVLVKVAAASTSRIVREVEAAWKDLGATTSFNSEMLANDFNSYYEAEERFNTFVLTFCFLAITIACMGLYGLSLFTAQQRIKEIGIRKVLGAPVLNILKMLSGDFLKLIGLAVLLAVPTIAFFMSRWLENFAYRIDLSIVHFAGGAIAAVVIAQLTISYHAIKAAVADPTDSLRYE